MGDENVDIDTISLVNLQLPNGVSAQDIWNEKSIQPALVTIVLELRNGFSSAASLDELDASTVHYGKLAKAVREACNESPHIDQAHRNIWEACKNTIPQVEPEFIVRKAEITVKLPKATTHGECLANTRKYVLSATGAFEQPPKHITSFQKLRLMALVGVNDKERRGRQAILLTCHLTSDDNLFTIISTSAKSGTERRIAMMIEETSYETLEALADHISTALFREFAEQKCYLTHMRLDIEKPSAVLYADAPIITIQRCFKPQESKKRSYEAADIKSLQSQG